MHRIEGTNYTLDSLGRKIFTDGPPATTCPAGWLNSIQEEIARLCEYYGIPLYSQLTDQYDCLIKVFQQNLTIYDYIITSQASFNNIIERVGANHYKIKDTYQSVYIKFISGGYACYGASSFLSDGDTWGYIDTNLSTLIFFESGAFLQFGDYPGYLNINTNYCSVYSPDVRGSGVGAAAVNYSFYINASNVALYNPKTSSRISNTNYTAFYSNVNNNLNFIYSPQIKDINTTGGTLKAFYQCRNVSNFYVTNFDSTSGITTLFDSCQLINNGSIYDCVNTAEHLYAFHTCYNIANVNIDTFQHTGAVAAKNAILFQSCSMVDNDSIRVTSVSVNGTGYATDYISCTFSSEKILSVEDHTESWTITNFDNEGLYTVSHGNTTKEIIATLPTLAQNQGKRYTLKSSGNGIARFYTTELIDGKASQYIFSDGDIITVVATPTEWKVLKHNMNLEMGGFGCSDWTDRNIGNTVITMDNVSGTYEVGEIVKEYSDAGHTTATGRYGRIIAVTGTTLTLIFGDGKATFTNDYYLLGQNSGATSDVNGNSKNAESNLIHNTGYYFNEFEVHLLVTLGATTFDITNIQTVEAAIAGFDATNGANLASVNSNSCLLETGTAGLIIKTPGSASFASIATSDYSGNIYIRRRV